MDKKDISLIVAFIAKLDTEYANSLLNKNPFVPIFCKTRRTQKLLYASVDKTCIEYANKSNKDIQVSKWARFLNSFAHCIICQPRGIKNAYYTWNNLSNNGIISGNQHSCTTVKCGQQRTRIYQDYQMHYWIPQLESRNFFPANIVTVQVLSISRDSGIITFTRYNQNLDNLFNFVFNTVRFTNMVNFKIHIYKYIDTFNLNRLTMG